MKGTFRKMATANLVSIGVMAIVAGGMLASPSTAVAACETKYRTECVKTDKDGRCEKYERVSYEVCPDDNKPIHVTPPKQECFECTEYNKDGSCKKTKKVAC